MAEFDDIKNRFGYAIVGETTLVATGGYNVIPNTNTNIFNDIVLLQPNTGRRTLSTTLPIGVSNTCSIAVNPTSKLRE